VSKSLGYRRNGDTGHGHIPADHPTKGVKPFPVMGFALNSGFFLVAVKHISNRDTVVQSLKRRFEPQEHILRIRNRSATKDVLLNGFSHIRHQGQRQRFPRFLLYNMDFVISPTNVFQFQIHDVYGAQAGTRAKQDNGKITFPHIGGNINLCQYQTEFFLRDGWEQPRFSNDRKRQHAFVGNGELVCFLQVVMKLLHLTDDIVKAAAFQML